MEETLDLNEKRKTWDSGFAAKEGRNVFKMSIFAIHIASEIGSSDAEEREGER